MPWAMVPITVHDDTEGIGNGEDNGFCMHVL